MSKSSGSGAVTSSILNSRIGQVDECAAIPIHCKYNRVSTSQSSAIEVFDVLKDLI
jgi:hypothetical protein